MIKIYEALAREKYTYNNCCLKKNQNAPRPSEHPPVRGKNVVVSHVQRSIGCQPEKTTLHGGQEYAIGYMLLTVHEFLIFHAHVFKSLNIDGGKESPLSKLG